MKPIKLLFLVITIFCVLFDSKAYSQVVVVKKGDTVPYDGVLFTKEKELEVRQAVLDLEYERKKNLKLTDLSVVSDKQITEMNKRIELYDQRMADLYKKETTNESDRTWNNAIYFLSGALITGLIGYGVIQAYR